MNINQKISLVGLLATLAALEVATLPASQAFESQPKQSTTVEARLSRLTQILQKRADELPEMAGLSEEERLLAGWINGGRGGFLNSRPWRNGWADGGGFLNRRGGSGFVNSRGRGGFVNRGGRGGFVNIR